MHAARRARAAGAAGLLALACLAPAAAARELLVGPGRALATPSAAARAARDGDRVLIDAGTYRGDAAVWTASGLTIRAAGGAVVVRGEGAHAEGKALWVVKGRDTTIEGIAFEDARVPDGNGAGIRHEGLGLTVRRCRFEHNQMGMLTHNDPRDTILIERSVFARNGPGPRHNHNLYVGRAGKLTVRASWLHHARVGHNVKSRAAVTHLLHNRIMDGADGHSSYAVDLPDGGDALLVGNLVQQGPRTENWALVSFAAEGRHHAFNRLRMVHNTLVNDADDAIFVHVHPGPVQVRLAGNLMVGPGRAYLGPAPALARDLHLAQSAPAQSIFVDRAGFDYRLRPDRRVVDVAPELPQDLPAPRHEYRHEADEAPRPLVGRARDLGALERRTAGRSIGSRRASRPGA